MPSCSKNKKEYCCVPLPEMQPCYTFIHVCLTRYDAYHMIFLQFYEQERMVAFTPLQYHLLLPLLEADGRLVSDSQLLERAYHSQFIAKRTLEKQIEHIRSKLCPYGLEVSRVRKKGYLLTEVLSDIP